MSNVVGCVICYGPDAERVRRLTETMLTICSYVLIYDNGSGAERVGQLENLKAERVELHPSADNKGLPIRMNSACSRARELGAEWLLYFDQDSEPDTELLQDLVAAAHSVDDSVAVIASPFVDSMTGRAGVSEASIERSPRTPIAAGSLYRLHALRDCGGFDQSFPVDLFDFELALRLQTLGREVVYVKTSWPLRHSVGRRSAVVSSVTVLDRFDHEPWRQYLQIQASIQLIRRYSRSFPGWTLRLVASRLLQTALSLAAGPRRLARARAMFFGLTDGIRKRPEASQLIRRAQEVAR